MSTADSIKSQIQLMYIEFYWYLGYIWFMLIICVILFEIE